MSPFLCPELHTCSHEKTCTHGHAHTCMHGHTLMNRHVYTCTNTDMHTRHIHAHAHTYTLTCTHVQVHAWAPTSGAPHRAPLRDPGSGPQHRLTRGTKSLGSKDGDSRFVCVPVRSGCAALRRLLIPVPLPLRSQRGLESSRLVRLQVFSQHKQHVVFPHPQPVLRVSDISCVSNQPAQF